MRFYFDYNATTPLCEKARQAFTQHIDLMNPSSVHTEGRRAKELIEKARGKVSGYLDCDADQILWTSGTTESNNHLFTSLAQTPNSRKKIITTTVEHDAVLKPLENLEKKGFIIKKISVDRHGKLDWENFHHELDDQTLLVSVMLANNETGIIFPFERIILEAHQKGALVHTDAACAVGKIPLFFKKWDLDFLSFSAHKFYGPKGVGGLLVKKDLTHPLLFGGPQERGLRAGTENVPGIIATAEAIRFSYENLEKENQRLVTLRNLLKNGIQAIDFKAVFHEAIEAQLPGTFNVGFSDVQGQTLVTRLDLEGVASSVGSACYSGTMQISRVLREMGISQDEARGSLRFSFGRFTTEEEVKGLLDILRKILPEMSP